MPSSDPPAPPRSGLSLYANLLDPNASTAGTISRAPVTFAKQDQDKSEDDTAKKPQMNAAALRFQPTKRPQAQSQAQKAKPKPGFSKIPSSSAADTSSPDPISKAPAPSSAAPAVRSTIADWAGDDDEVNEYYAGDKRQRGGRKKRKKNNQEEKLVPQNWDDIYDPSRPNNYEDYKHSDEKYREIREWKDRLYAHRYAQEEQDSDRMSEDGRPSRNQAFAPPSAFAFAPPASYDDEAPKSRMSTSPVPTPSHPPTDLPPDESGDDVYARRMRMSQAQAPPPSADSSLPPPPPPPTIEIAPPPPPPPSANTTGSISRAPVRYSLPEPSTSLPSTEAELDAAIARAEQEDAAAPSIADNDDDDDAPARSSRPGQKGFAERLMSKMGWTKGSGLGAEGTGMVNPLRVQMDKRKKKSDAEGGGWAAPQTAKIVGGKMGKKKGAAAADGEEGGNANDAPAISEVVMLKGMVDGMDLAKEMGAGLMQEIGEECGEKYGRVERVFVHQHSSSEDSIPVFIKFTSQLSALRAVNALQGRMFNGNTIRASFFNSEAFEAGIYE